MDWWSGLAGLPIPLILCGSTVPTPTKAESPSRPSVLLDPSRHHALILSAVALSGSPASRRSPQPRPRGLAARRSAPALLPLGLRSSLACLRSAVAPSADRLQHRRGPWRRCPELLRIGHPRIARTTALPTGGRPLVAQPVGVGHSAGRPPSVDCSSTFWTSGNLVVTPCHSDTAIDSLVGMIYDKQFLVLFGAVCSAIGRLSN